MRYARQSKPNSHVTDWTRTYRNRDNLSFMEAVQRSYGKSGRSWVGAIGLVGGRSLAAYMQRHAQSVLRWDQLPSYWSHCFLIAGGSPRIGRTPIFECALESASDALAAERNGVSVAALARYEDAKRFPNVAVITFSLSDKEIGELMTGARHPNIDRTRFNMWELLGTWFPYAWRMRVGVNPLADGVRMPSAAYVEMVYERIGLDLTPGASDRNSSPEHFWQTAKWWSSAYEALGKNVHVHSCVRQPQAELAQPLSLTLP